MRRIKRNDVVVVTAGEDRGKKGKVLRVLDEKNRVIVEGVNMVFKHVRRSQQNPQGGRIRREGPVSLSNVMPFCEKCQTGVRVKFQGEGVGKRRVCAKCAQPFPA